MRPFARMHACASTPSFHLQARDRGAPGSSDRDGTWRFSTCAHADTRCYRSLYMPALALACALYSIKCTLTRAATRVCLRVCSLSHMRDFMPRNDTHMRICMAMVMCTSTHTGIHAYTHTRIHAHVPTQILPHACRHSQDHADMYTGTRMHVRCARMPSFRTFVLWNKRRCADAQMRRCARSCMHACMHARARPYPFASARPRSPGI